MTHATGDLHATAGTGKIGDDNRTIHFQVHDLNITIETGGLTNGTGNVTGVHLESAPVNATVGTGNVSVSFTAEMNNYNPALGITTSIYEQPSSEAREAFILAAQEDEDSEITGIAYAVYFIKTNLTGDDKIQNATLRLTVSEDWVKAHGGIDKIRIFRRGDDGRRPVLPTTYEGMENGMMVFTAVSPEVLRVRARRRGPPHPRPPPHPGAAAVAVAAPRHRSVRQATSRPATASSSRWTGQPSRRSPSPRRTRLKTSW